MKNIFTYCILLYCFCFQTATAQTTGDYRSNVTTTGVWNTASNWQVYDGNSWVTASTPPTSADGVITIVAGDSIRLNTATAFDQVVIEAGGVLAIFNTTTPTTFTLDDGAGNDIEVNGRLYISAGATLTGSGIIQNNSGGVVVLRNQGISLINTINNGTMNVSGTGNLNNATLTNNGTFNLVDYTLNLNNATFINNSLVNLLYNADTYIATSTTADTGYFNNSSTGVIYKTNASGIAYLNGTVKFINDGTVKGVGEFVFTNTITNNGIIAPGDGGTGILTVNPAFITGKTPTLQLQIKTFGGVAGTNYDQLKISTNGSLTASVSGVKLSLTDDTTDAVGTVYTLIAFTSTSGSITGPFAQTSVPSNYGNLSFAGSTVTIQKVAQAISWDGGAGTTNWDDANNWNPNVVPVSADHVTINSGSMVLVNTNAICQNLTLNNAGLVLSIQSGSSLTVNGLLTLTQGQIDINDQSLALNGTIASSGSGTIKGSANSSLTIGGTAGGSFGTLRMAAGAPNNEVKNFTLNRTGAGATVSIGTNGLRVSGIVTLNNGTLNAAGNLTLASTSIGTTGCVAPISGTAQITGFVTVERYIPQSRRAYRDITPIVSSNTSTIFSSWQESGLNSNGYGVQITGSAAANGSQVGTIDAATGFDKTISGNKSMNTFTINTTTGSGSWLTVNSTNKAGDTLVGYKPYRLVIRGNRQNSLYADNDSMNAPAVLRATGRLITGNVSFTTTGVTANGYTNNNIRLNSADITGYTMVGNPYPSPVDWLSVYDNSSNIDPSYWVWDPLMGTNGAYVTYSAVQQINSNGSSAVNRFIQPGQGFFIRNDSSTSPVLNFAEVYKATSSSNLTNVFRNSSVPARLAVGLYKKINADTFNMDAVLISFDNTFSNAKGREDAGKISNTTENLSISKGSYQLSIEGRLQPTISDTIALRITTVSAGSNYILQVDASQFTINGLQPILIDRFTQTQTHLSNGLQQYAFTTTSDTLSYNHRFRIAFTASALPVRFVQVKANAADGRVRINWTAFEEDGRSYTVEHATANNERFTAIGSVDAAGNGEQQYTFTHQQPAAMNYYRIKAADNNGSIAYSNVVAVALTAKNMVSIYPNPVTGRRMHMRTDAMQPGSYTLRLMNASGKLVWTNNMSVSNSSSDYTLALPATITKGTYTLQMMHGDWMHSQNIVIAE